MIEDYDFGKIRIDGTGYSKDVLILPQGVKEGWWRTEGHLLQVEDLREVLEEKPEVLVVGTGYSGCMRVSPKIKEYLEERGIELMIETTGEACKAFNELSNTKKAAAALHLTC